jgi:hypothetical protein
MVIVRKVGENRRIVTSDKIKHLPLIYPPTLECEVVKVARALGELPIK